MDYDGNDFQNPNYQLSGEDNNRFSSGLRPFSLPKFELDEHFQVNLRFDSLVESEPLIGIQDQEERNWIENFSSENTSLDFNSCPSEPCSISRRKNVWSDATSSESVEILLKSVGDDDVIHKRSSFFDLDNSDEVIGVNSHMDPSCFQSGSLDSNGAQIVAEDSILLPEKCENEFDGPNLVSAIVDDVKENPEEVIPSDECCMNEVETLPTEESLVSEEISMDDPCKLGDESVVINATGETQDLAAGDTDAGVLPADVSGKESVNLLPNKIVEHQPEYYSQEILPTVKSGSLRDGSTDERKGELNEDSGISNLDPMSKPSSPLVEGYSKHSSSEKGGLLEDVAHQIESLGKGNSSMHNEMSPEMHVSESSGLDESAKTNSFGASSESKVLLETSELPVPSDVTISNSSMTNVPVVAPEENEGVEDPLKTVESHGIAERTERNSRDSTSAEFGGNSDFSVSLEVQKSSEDEVHEGNKFDVANNVVTDVTQKAENEENFHVQESNLTEETIVSNSETSTLQVQTLNVAPVQTDSGNLKSQIIEKSTDSKDQENVMHIPSETQGLNVETVQTISDHNDNLRPASLPGVSGQSPLEAVCNSPTKIASAELSPALKEKQKDDKKTPDEQSLSAPPKESRNKKSSRKSKDRSQAEERTFTFEVGSKTASPESIVGGWKPFSVMESFDSPQVKEMNSTKSGSKKANLAALGEAQTPADSTRKKDRSKPPPFGSLGKSTQKKRSTANETSITKEASERSVGTSSNSTVSASLTQREGNPYIEGSGSAQFHQPFTDAQQVQLRAQIFVYGSLIQGIPPDEACMVSAFGNNDGARSSWEGTWRISQEKFNSQNSPASFATPLPSLSGARIHEQSPRSTLQSRPPITPIDMTVSRSIGKGSPTVVSNLMPLTAPMWQDMSQSSVPRGPSVDPGQLLPPAHGYQISQSKQYLPTGSSPWVPQASSVPWLGPSQTLAPEKRTHFSVPLTSETTTSTAIRESTPPRSPNMQFLKTSSGTPLTPPVSMAGKMSPQIEKKPAGTTTQKARKQKKREGLPLTEQDNPTSVPVPTPSMPAISLSSLVPIPPTHFPVVQEKGKEQRFMLSEEARNKIEQAKVLAEDAAAFAAAAIKHSEGIWSQLSILKNSGLSSITEAKIASAAAAVGAASSVAKAAAAAAKVAADAAMQAKLMADEAVVEQKSTPSFLMKGNERIAGSTTLVISAVRETARRRVEATSAASKRAENLDAILKAAELAAVAVCQAGAVVALGDPLPFTLNDLIEAGPGGFWKAPLTFDLGNDAGDNPIVLPAIDEGHNVSVANPTDLTFTEENPGDSAKKKFIQDGSLVEVLTDKDDARRIWYSANVLSVKNDKAHVIYNDLPDDGGGEKLREWIALEGEVDQPPRIRLAHPIMSVKYEGTRKRRREAVGNYLWAVGDRVDVLVHNGWCEGVVTEKSKEDETKLTVHFSGGELSVVRAWQLRPSLVWKDGHWVEWSRLRENISYPHEGDTPKDKRQKIGTLEPEVYPKFKSVDLSKEPANFISEETGLPLLTLSDKEKLFSLGKSTTSTDPRNPNQPKMRKPGQKEGGSRVVFGVPKPGKKRKFMEVSKHYVAGKSEGLSLEGEKHQLPMKDALKSESKIRKVVESKPPRPPSQRQNVHARDRSQFHLSEAFLGSMGGANGEASRALVADAAPSVRHVAATSAGLKKKAASLNDGGRGGASGPERAKSEERQDQAGELRRSSRRIQPTSRLLEGLQSSMVVSKIPDKGAKASSKNNPPPVSKNGATHVHG